MLNKNNLEKITVNSTEDLAPFKGKDLTDKYLVLNTIVKDIKLGTLDKCVIEGGGISCQKLTGCNLFDVGYVYADEINFSILQRCVEIRLGDIAEGYKLTTSQFFHCKTILITDATVEDCIFNDFSLLSLTSTNMCNCIVADVVCKDVCAISMEDGEISDVSFENIELRNDAYLIEGFGSPWVEDSVFFNIRTSRKDKRLFCLENVTGKVFKKNTNICFVDEESCSGLLFIADLDGDVKVGPVTMKYPGVGLNEE